MDFCAWIGILKPNQCLNLPNTKTRTAMQNAEKQGGLGSFKVISNVTIQSAYNFLFTFNRNCIYLVSFVRHT